MCKPVFASLLFASLAVHAISQTAIKGHHLGETPEQFLQADPEIRKNLAECHAGEPKPITQDEVHAMSKAQLQALQLEQTYNPSRKQLEAMASNGQLFTLDTRYPQQKAYCDSLVNALEKGSQIPFFGDIQFSEINLPRTLWFFGGGTLMEIVVDFKGASFADVETDLAKRIGTAPIESHPAVLNTYGATWNDQMATWLTSELCAKLLYDPNPAKPELELTVTARWLYDARTKEKANAPSPLDKP
jgi:hypothetical protein